MSNHSRRTFVRSVSGAVVSASLMSGMASAGENGGTNTRFLIDLEEVSRNEVPSDVEIVHDLSGIDVLAARGDPDDVPGATSTIPDVAVYQDEGAPTGGPVHEIAATERKGPAWDSGEPTHTEYQWDKREQRLGDLTERPDDRKVVHETTEGEGTRVAVVDTGVYDGHPDLADAVNAELSENFTTDPYDWRPNGAGDHGTHVAGIIAGTNANGAGILGTAPETEIVSHRVFSGVKGATGDSLAALYAAADKGCDVANFSVGYMHYDPEEYPYLLEIEELYERLAEYAHERGMSIVNSAGNDAMNMSKESVLSMPTEADGVFGVSATGPNGYLWDDTLENREDVGLKQLAEPTDSPAFYTNYGDGVDVSAAGGDVDLDALENEVPGYYHDFVYSTIVQYDDDGNPIPGYGWKAGTSMSAPQVTGAYALVRSLRPAASPEEVEGLITETARDAPGGERYHGAGHLDLRRLVREASQ